MIKYIVLFIILGFTCLLSIFYYYNNTKLHLFLKPLPVLSMLIFVAIFAPYFVEHFIYVMLIALVFCAIGDVFIVYDRNFFWGIVSFFFAQLAFIAYLILNGAKVNYFILGILIACGILAFVSLLPSHNEDFAGKLIPGCLIYSLALSAMVGVAISYDLSRFGHISLMSIGAISFMLSDGILSMFQFKLRAKWMYVFVLTFYYLAVFLMSLSVVVC